MDIQKAKEGILNLDKNTELENIKIDEIPIWWFFKPVLILNSLPSPFLNFKEISNEIKRTKLRILKTKIIASLLKSYIIRNEKKKRILRKREIHSNNVEKLLFLTYSNHIKEDGILRLSSIINKIKEDKRIEPFILVSDPISNKAGNSILKYEHTLYEYITSSDLKEAHKLSKEINSKWKISKKDDIHNFLKIELDFLLSKEMIELVLLYYFAFKRIIDQENIKAVVITADTGFQDKALIASIKDKNIPIISVHHGNPGTVPIETFSKTKICLKGRAFKRNLEKTNFKGEMVITGFTDSDEILKYKKEVKKDKKTVLITTSPLVEDNFMKKGIYQNYIKKYLEEINKINDIEIIISLHPREKDIEKYQEITKNYQNVKVIKKIDIKYLYELLNYADLLIFFGSGTAIEANILNKPTVYINLFGKDMPYIRLFEEAGPILEIDKEADISIPIKDILENKKIREKLTKEREKFVEDYCYKVDGKSTERIVDEIYKSLENG
jgi:hypothetical protein